jgi:hypothetical protein
MLRKEDFCAPYQDDIQMKSDPMSASEAKCAPGAVAQPVAAPLTPAAIFLVATLHPGFDNRETA